MPSWNWRTLAVVQTSRRIYLVWQSSEEVFVPIKVIVSKREVGVFGRKEAWKLASSALTKNKCVQLYILTRLGGA
jgi:hypothetical protein